MGTASITKPKEFSKIAGDIAEGEFKKWLERHGIPYWYIQQDMPSFSQALKDYLVKRPDFLILLPNFGFVLVDVKNTEAARKYEKFFLGAKGVERYLNLQRIFNLQSWCVISSERYHFKTWFWIPISKIAKAGFVFKTKDGKRECYSVPISE